MRAALLVVLLSLAAAAPAAAQAPTPATTPTPAPTFVPVPTPAPAPPPKPTIKRGVTAGGVEVGGQTVAQARATLKAAYGRRARKTFTLRKAGEKLGLPSKRVELEFAAKRTARRALKARRNARVKLAISFIRTPIREFVDRFAAKVNRDAVDAGISIHTTRIGRTRAHRGRRLAVKKVNRVVERAFADPRRKRSMRPKLVRTKPAVGAKDLRRRYPSIVTIDQSSFTLRLFRNLRYSRSYTVAVGQPAYPTPNGLFSIQSKQVNPTWTAPNSPWAGESAGQSYSSSDPNNPLKARWMGVNGSIGIHGTGQEETVGSRASHGCIRMRVADVIDLFDRVSIGSPVLISS